MLKGIVEKGIGDFKKRMTDHAGAFQNAVGERLVPGTININIGMAVPVVEHFRVRGEDISEPGQDLLFEICRINGVWAYRIRPLNTATGEGGHGDHVFEIACSVRLSDVNPGDSAEVSLFR